MEKVGKKRRGLKIALIALAVLLVLAAGGYVIDAARGTPRSPGFYLSRQDCNELAMLTRPGTKVTILRGKGEEP